MKRFPKIFVQLGRAGDVLNILPLVKREFLKHKLRPRVLVAQKFADILEGVSYAEPMIWPGEFEDIMPAIWTAGREPGDLIVSQVYGREYSPKMQCTSFARDSWALAQADVPWGSLPLEFDRRNAAREAKVIIDLVQTPGKPFVVLASDGISSPLPGAFVFRSFLKHALAPDFDVIDMGKYRAPHLFDLLGLIRRAHCVVTVDCGILHLAHATKTPVIAFVEARPTRWHGSAWRPNHVARFAYHDFPECGEALIDAVRNARWRPARPGITHAWTEYRGQAVDDETSRRVGLARKTWAQEYATGYWGPPRRFGLADAKRDSRSVGDPRPVPFVRDVIEHAIAGSRRDFDIIALTNADVSFTPGLTGWVLDGVRRHGALFCHRWDFDRLERPCVSEAEVMARGKFYPGSDAFFFSVGWWKQHGAEFPDMVIGREQWDEVFRQLIKRHGGASLDGAIYHERHASFWERMDQHRANLGNWHNRNRAAEWFERTGYRPNDFEWMKAPVSNF